MMYKLIPIACSGPDIRFVEEIDGSMTGLPLGITNAFLARRICAAWGKAVQPYFWLGAEAEALKNNQRESNGWGR